LKPAGVSDRRSIWRVGPESTWTTVVPVVFIIVSLLSLALLPLVVARKTTKMRGEITRLAEPARQAANFIQMDLSAEVDKLIAYQVTGQQSYRREYLALVERQETNRRKLAQLLPRLDEELGQDLTALFVQTSRWHQGVAQGEFVARQLPNEVFLSRLFESHAAYESSLRAASELELELQTAIDSRVRRMSDTERLNRWLTIGLTLLALTSALLVAGLGRQMRLLAREAMKRRLEAERETNEAQRAREMAEREERRAAFLAAAGQELATSLDYEHTIATLARLIVPNLAEMSVVDIAEPEGALRRVAVAHRNPEDEAVFAAEIGTVRREVPEALVRIMQEGQPSLVGSSSGLYAYLTGQADGDSRTLIFLPMVSRGQTIGIAAAISAEGRPFTSTDLPLFAELARRASLSIDNSRLYLESQQAVRAREEVLAIVSHDLRNPLSAVSLGASLLQMSESVSDEDREQLDTIVVSAKRMNRLIADLLDVTRLEGGKRLPVELESVEVTDMLQEAQELFRAPAADLRPRRTPSRHAGAVEPHRKLDEVHPSRRTHRRPRHAPRRRGAALRLRHRPGDPEGAPQRYLQPLLAGQAHRAHGRRPGAADRQGHRGSTRRQDLGGERAGERDAVLLHAADRHERGRAACRAHADGGICSASLTLSSAKSRIKRRPSSSDAS
jgi:signal transduction histidine kinase